jgi:hypothetical protein
LIYFHQRKTAVQPPHDVGSKKTDRYDKIKWKYRKKKRERAQGKERKQLQELSYNNKKIVERKRNKKGMLKLVKVVGPLKKSPL